jgi:hypothetical protein
MRTTLEIDDDVLQAARSAATAEGKSVGKALSDLARLGLESRSRSKTRSGFPLFDVAPDTPPITLEMVKDALDEE